LRTSSRRWSTAPATSASPPRDARIAPSRRRLKHWAALGIAQQLHALALAAYDRMIGLELAEASVDGCITKAPCGGDAAGRSPADRGKQSTKRWVWSVAAEAAGVPLGIVAAGEIARKGVPAPIQAGKRRVVERGTPALLDERLQQAATLHRASWRGRGLVLVSGAALPHLADADPTRDQALPLGRSPHHPATQVTPVAGPS
jgi:hypothetical protein